MFGIPGVDFAFFFGVSAELLVNLALNTCLSHLLRESSIVLWALDNSPPNQ